MTRTYAMLLATFGRDIGRLMYGYFEADTIYAHCIGRAGYYEACIDRKFVCNQIMIGACDSGYFEIVRLMVTYGATWVNEGLVSACIGGHVDVAQFMIVNKASDLNRAMFAACTGGNSELIRMLLEHGAAPCKCPRGQRLNSDQSIKM